MSRQRKNRKETLRQRYERYRDNALFEADQARARAQSADFSKLCNENASHNALIPSDCQDLYLYLAEGADDLADTYRDIEDAARDLAKLWDKKLLELPEC